ncbi:MAG: endonuclease I family protein [Bacteroidales bacterium]
MKKSRSITNLRLFAKQIAIALFATLVVACGGTSNEDILDGLKPGGGSGSGTAPDAEGDYPDKGSASLSPVGYYNAALGLKQSALKAELYEIIQGHNVRSYYQLWTDFRSTDAKSNGKVWDVYDNSTNYTFGDDQDKGGGDSYSYNREHSIPKSWFGKSSDDKTPIYSDLYCLYPSDSKANSERSNYPFGIVTTQQWTNGTSKRGTAQINGKSTIVFEPGEDRKGDLARSYFYFATRYAYGGDGRSGSKPTANFSSWTNSAGVLALNTYPFYQQWALDILLKWHREDPVSEMEIKRHTAIYNVQKNRNPYIDYPVLVEHIWGNRKDQSFQLK